MSSAGDNSDSGLRRDLAMFRGEVGPLHVNDAIRSLGAAMDPIGERLGDYRIGRELGRGGMGVVYEADQISVPGRKVAVKLLLGFGGSETARSRFAREVEVVGQLDHPSIVPILSADLAGPTPYYAMKKIDGESLRDLLRRGELRGDCRRTATLVRDLALALQHAHERGVVHRDVKPGNVIVEAGGRAMLLDFGLARVLEETSDLTRSLDAIGTPDYMAPEQIARRFGAISARTDIYSLGVTLFECLSGRTPFAAESRTETLDRIVRADAPRLRSLDHAVPRDLENICAMAMNGDPVRRYATAGELASDLEAFLAFRPVRARPPGLLRRGVVLVRRHRLPAAAVAVGTITLVLAAAYWGWWLPRSDIAGRLANIDSAWHRRVAVDREIEAGAAALAERNRRQQRPGLDPGIVVLQQELRRLRAERNQLDGDVEAAIEACLAIDPGHAIANARYADLMAMQLRLLLQGSGIVSRRDQIEAVQQRLRRFDSEGRHAPLLQTDGRLSIRAHGPARVWLCPTVQLPDGRLLYVGVDDPAARDLGTTPVDAVAREGNYALRAACDGCPETILPLLVRRLAVQTPAECAIELRPVGRSQVDKGYRPVHAGFSVTVDQVADPAAPQDELRWVDGFQMTEREVRWQDVIDWLGELPPLLQEARTAQSSSGSSSSFLGHFRWVHIADLLDRLNQREVSLGTSHYVALPTPEEWVRAAQGADGRPYPWGWSHDWSFSQNYWSSVDAAMAMVRTRWPAEDVSTFLIRDMAGSLREICLPAQPMRELGNKQFLLHGGSAFSFRAVDLMVTSSRALLHNEPADDVGLRLVRRPLPTPPPGPGSLRLDVAAVEPNGVPAGWRVLGISGPFFEDLSDSGRVRSEGGQLALAGFAGNFSPQIMAYHPVDLPTGTLRATAAFSFHHTAKEERAIELRFGTQPGFEAHDQWFSCRIRSDHVALAMGNVGEATTVGSPLPRVPHGTTYRLEVEAREGAIHVSLGFAGGEPLHLEVDRPSGLPATWRYVGIRLPTLVGMQALVSDLAVDGR